MIALGRNLRGDALVRCEVIAVGTELLLGQIMDTNSSWMGEQLALAGIDSHFQSKVGDNQARIGASIRLGLERSDAVILCGGLGPTQDDITRESIAEVMGVVLERDPEMAERIREMFVQRKRHFAQNNLRQADKPVGAQFIAQMPGTAPGLVCPMPGDKVIYAVPGVPHEMREMVQGTVLPDLQRRAGVSAVIRSRVLRSWGESESGLAEMLGDRIHALDRKGNPTIAFQASGIEGLKIRITAKAPTEQEALALIAEEEAQVRGIVGDAIFATDGQNMEAAVLALLAERGLTLALAETVTGGLGGARLSEVPGAAEVFKGTIVGFSEPARVRLFELGDIPVSPEAAQKMALYAREHFAADIGIATTGVTAAHEQSIHPLGTVFAACAMADEVHTREVRLPGDARRIRQFSVISVLNLLRLRLIGSDRTQMMR